MRSNKVLDISEDNERIYFTFYHDNHSSRIIGLPKSNTVNKAIYAGTSFDSLHIVRNENVGQIFNALMMNVLRMHPAIKRCDPETVRLIDNINSSFIDKKT
jgi:hypothetical protein